MYDFTYPNYSRLDKLQKERDQLRTELAASKQEADRLREACVAALNHIAFVNDAGEKLHWPAMSMARGTERLLSAALEATETAVSGEHNE